MPLTSSDAMSRLAAGPDAGQMGGGMDVAPSPGGIQPTAGPPPQPMGPTGPGGPGQAPNPPDTPQEQQALDLLTKGALMLRAAAEQDPSIRYIVDDGLLKLFNMVTKHYGLEQEGKLALQQAQLTKQKAQAGRFNAPAGAQPPGPPVTPPGPMA